MRQSVITLTLKSCKPPVTSSPEMSHIHLMFMFVTGKKKKKKQALGSNAKTKFRRLATGSHGISINSRGSFSSQEDVLSICVGNHRRIIKSTIAAPVRVRVCSP